MAKQNLPRRYCLKPRKGKAIAFTDGGYQMIDHIYWRIFDTETGKDGKEFLNGKNADKELDRINKEWRAAQAK